ncbi:MAG: hypothetical protein K6U80_09990 [Firmicutes bacterium]|nr:hypothetical protein [Bacillota bacterium]
MRRAGIHQFRKYFTGIVLLTVLIFNYLTNAKAAIRLTSSSSGWTLPVDSSNLISGAGSDLTSVYLSPVNATVLTVRNCKNNADNWRIDVSRSDTIWDSANLALAVLRTSDGTYTPGATISGGTDFVPVSATATTFFRGSGNHSNITVQYQLTGMSVEIAPNNYKTTVTFTIVDTP